MVFSQIYIDDALCKCLLPPAPWREPDESELVWTPTKPLLVCAIASPAALILSHPPSWAMGLST